MNKDYYKVLDIEKTASEKEIKSAFRALAHKHHPDKGGDEKKFKEINEAYQILSNETKRAQYDRFGAMPNGFGGFGNGQGDFNAQYANYYSHFTGKGPEFSRARLKKIPLIGWILLFPILLILAFFGVIVLFIFLARTVSRGVSR